MNINEIQPSIFRVFSFFYLIFIIYYFFQYSWIEKENNEKYAMNEIWY